MIEQMNVGKSQSYIDKEAKYGAHNYHPLPVVLAKGEGVHVWDVEGKKYYDFLSAYSAVNQGHCHPRLVKSISEQAGTLALTSRAFYNNKLGDFEQYLSKTFGFDQVLCMNTGAEAVETAIKLCRKWAYESKGIEDQKAKIVVCENNFHGRTTTIISFSNDENAKHHFGPYTPGFISIPYNSVEALREVLKEDDTIAGFLVEPIQGEAGVFVPSDGYLREAKALCEEHNVLFIADEIQTGIARTGKMLAVDYDEVIPDVLILGKALSGGMYPVSAVLANHEIMKVMQPGQHGSTYGGNPLGVTVATTALDIVQDENLAENAFDLGEIFRTEMQKMVDEFDLLTSVRGRGLLNAVTINDNPESSTAWNICLQLRNNGLLAKPTHGNIIRFAPPLVMNESQLLDCLSIIKKTIQNFSEDSAN